MASKAFSRFVSFTSRLILKQLRTNTSKFYTRKSAASNISQSTKYHKINSFPNDAASDLSQNTTTMICDVEGGLLRSSNLFPYFMLVAFEAGSILRALVLLAVYPFLSLATGSEELRLRIMIMVCFFGLREDGFRLGSSVLPKYFLQDVGLEGFEVLNKKSVVKKVGVSNMPRVMVEGFLRDYMGFDYVVGRELKVFCGYFVGLMDDKQTQILSANGEDQTETVIGISSMINSSSVTSQMVSICDEIYLTNETERSCWSQLPTDNYLQPLVFHDGRLAFNPTWLASLAMFTWFPLGLCLALVRSFIGFFMPYTLSIPLLAFSGLKLRVSSNSSSATLAYKTEGILYVCNHRTLLDPLYLTFILKKDLTAVTYSLSRVSEILSPIKTVRLTRDFNYDSKLMEHMLTQGNLVICPEGTTCREPYLLRFSPLFAEMSKVIVPVALDTKVSMFYGTTAGGFKCLDPFFFLMNPFPCYTVMFLNPVSGLSSSSSSPSLVHDAGVKVRDSRRFEVANEVQSGIAKTLNFKSTKFTRKNKYLVLAGNEGIVST